MRVRHGQLIAAVAAIALIAGATTFAQTGSGQSVLRHAGIASPPSRYTELSFVDPSKLQLAVPRPGGHVLVQFTIANHNAAEKAYHWQIGVAQPDPHVLKTGDVRLANGAQAYVERVIAVRCSRRTQIAVRLSTGQQIDFWIECN